MEFGLSGKSLQEVIAINDAYERRFRNVRSRKYVNLPTLNLWTPSELPNGVVWYGDDVVLDGGRVSQWSDMGGGNNHAVQNIHESRPFQTVDSATGKNQLHWGVEDGVFLDVPIHTIHWGNDDFSVFVVAQSDLDLGGVAHAGIISNRFGDGYTNGYGWWTMGYKDGEIMVEKDPGEPAPAFAFDPRGQGKQIYYMRKSGWNVDGFLNGENVGGGVHTKMGGTTNDVRIGVWLGAEQHWRGEIQEVLILPYVLNENDRQLVEGYLANKWKITLQTGHPYRDAPPVLS